MKFSWKWLSELVDLDNIRPQQVIEKLTLAGFEVENNSIEDRHDIKDKIFDVSINSNRYDASSMIGMARELSSILDKELINQPDYKELVREIKNIGTDSATIDSNILHNLKISTVKLSKKKLSPLWLTNYLIACGIQPTNILSDICTYINIKWGQDIEIFDVSKINSQEINNSLIQINTEKIHKLLGAQNQHTLEDLSILKYDETILSIFGIRSNTNLYCNDASNKLIVIGHICNPIYIKDKTAHLTQKTEKSIRHLKYIISDDLDYAYNEAIYLILTLNKGCLIKYWDYKNTKLKPKPSIISIHHQTIKHILGPYQNTASDINNTLTEGIINNVLRQLKFKSSLAKSIFYIEIPEYRKKDINRDIDIIEEIARMHGFNKFIDKPPVNHQTGKSSEVSKIIKKIRCILRGFGLHETIHSSLDKSHSNNPNSIQIYNPLQEDQNQLKESLIKQIIHTNTYNKKQKNLPLECFEVGKTFYNENQLYVEQIHIAGLMGNPTFSKKMWSEKNTALTWFQAKGLMEEFFEKIHAQVDWANPTNYKNSKIYKSCYDICHPYRIAIIYNRETRKEVGILGQLSATIHIDNYQKYNSYIFEINLSELINCRKIDKHLNYNLKTYSIYPSVTRDISLILSQNESAYLMKNTILKEIHPLAESVEIFNEYEENRKAEEIRYVGFRITYRSQYKTLNDDDIKTIDHKLNTFLKNR